MFSLIKQGGSHERSFIRIWHRRKRCGILCKNVEGIHLKQVFVLPEFENLPYFSNDGKGMVTADDVDIVFECLSGTEPANTLITLALEHGKHVITSNKATVSPNLERYVEIAERTCGSIQIEASVAGGIPFFRCDLKAAEVRRDSRLSGNL